VEDIVRGIAFLISTDSFLMELKLFLMDCRICPRDGTHFSD
jgi:hypothetical protein